MGVRFVATASGSELKSLFGAVYTVGGELAPSYNIAPTQPVRVIVEQSFREAPDPQRHLRTAIWGATDRDTAASLATVHSETVTENQSLRSSALERRAVIPVAGYYEWRKTDAGQTPCFVRGGSGVIAMAGLYEVYPDPLLPEGDPNKWVWTCSVLTRSAPNATERSGGRSPLIVPESLWGRWLDPHLVDAAEVAAMIDSVPDARLDFYEVSGAVDDLRNNTPALLDPV